MLENSGWRLELSSIATFDDFAKSDETASGVIPAYAGIQYCQYVLGSGIAGMTVLRIFWELVSLEPLRSQPHARLFNVAKIRFKFDKAAPLPVNDALCLLKFSSR